MPQPLTRSHSGLCLVATLTLVGSAPAVLARAPCSGSLGVPAVAAAPLRIQGTEPTSVDLTLAPGHTYLIEVQERDNDALVEILDPKHALVARSDHPERRTGIRRAIVTAPDLRVLTVRVTGKEPANVAGSATVRGFDLAAVPTDCQTIVKQLAAADADYAAGQQISRGLVASSSHSARDAFQRAARGYSAAEQALGALPDRQLRGQTALALAGLEYLDLQDWALTAEWAKAAADWLGAEDPYRRARADALAAAAWIEIASGAPAGKALPGYGVPPAGLFERARRELRRLSRFHLERGERYDAGLQLTNIGVSYVYEGRYSECVAAFTDSSRLFGSIHDTVRRAQAWQNQALCLWGQGRLAQAVRLLERALHDVGPEPYPTLYVGVTTNTALADYTLGRFDESLRLYDRALAFSRKVQSSRDEAYCLYGIGVNYYGLGDLERAREFLERSLVIRTPALDGRGRMQTLRALATVAAEQGRVQDALASDREALSLAASPSAIARIRIQLAVHTAAAGQRENAKTQLDAVISAAAEGEPIIPAEARLQRAVLLRKMGRPAEALTDLNAARPRLHALGGVSDEFTANLELARTFKALGQPRAALEALERALALSDAVRLQTANPELRSQLQTPLRAAYDLKIELLRERYDEALAAAREEDAAALAAAAFATADASRAHSFADVAAQEYSPAVRSALAPQFRRREQLYQQLATLRFALDARIERSGPDNPRTRHLISDVTELERQADVLNTQIAARTSAAPRAHAGRERVTLPLLPPETALVSYWLGSESAYAWVVSRGEIHWMRLPPPAAIAQRAAAFHRALTRFVDVGLEERLEDARTLYEAIVRPVEPWLADSGQWVVVPDGALDYVPFAALRAPGAPSDAFVALRHDVALTPAVWRLSTLPTRAEPRGGRMLLVADPVYDAGDPRLGAASRGAAVSPQAANGGLPGAREYRRLPYTAQEAAEISALFTPADVDQLTGLNATRERFLALDLAKYRFIHIAAHGVVDAQVPQLSALVLGSYDARGNVVDGAVRVADLSLETLTAEVAVFSACDTALGKQVPSEGLLGIGSTMLARGARAVVASLWPVVDEIGAQVMTEFYRHLLHDSMSPPAALGAATRAVLSRDGSADPALWGAFQVSVVALGPGRALRNSAATETVTRTATTTRP